MLNEEIVNAIIDIYESICLDGDYLETFANDYCSYSLMQLKSYVTLLEDANEGDYISELKTEAKRFSKILEMANYGLRKVTE